MTDQPAQTTTVTRRPAAWRPTMIGLAVLAILAGGLFASGWTPTIPSNAGSTIRGQATLAGAAAPDGQAAPGADATTVAPAGQGCLDRIASDAGWLDLCWAAARTPDGDPAKDYYLLRLYGTLSGADGSGIQWSVVRADLLGSAADGVFDGWPEGTIDGPCQSIELGYPLRGIGPATEEVCGRTVGANASAPWAYAVSWQCVGCVIADRSARSVVLYESVAVVEGARPAWTIRADFGG